MAPGPDPNSVGDGAKRDEATIKVPSKDPKKKDDKKEEDLSEEDLQLKQNLELYVERVQDPNPELQKAALESMRQEIRASTSSMTSVPKPLKFLRPHYGTLKEFHKNMAESDLKKLLADILSVLALTMSAEGQRESLGYRLTGSEGDIGSWGHEYVRNLAGEIAEEYTVRQGEEASIEDLMDLVQQIVAFHMKHNAETEAVDLLMDVEDLDLLLEHVDRTNFRRTCNYLTSAAKYLPGPDDMLVLDIAYMIYIKFEEYPNALQIALFLDNMQYVKQVFTSCTDLLRKKQFCYMISRHGITFELDPEMVENDVDREMLQDIVNNTKLSEGYLTLARDIEVMEAKTPEDIYKAHLLDGRASSGPSADSARQNLAATFVNAFVNAGFGQDKLMTVPSDSTSGSAGNWLFKNKEHGKTSAAASLGMILLWDVDAGLGRPRKAYKPEEEAASAAKAAKLRGLQSQFMANHHNKIYTKEAVDLSTKLLEINPEAYTAWNYRKLAVEDKLSRIESDPDLVKTILDEELRVVESALKQNFKSYGAWHHRKWVLSKGHSSVGNELRLLDQFQKLDTRNFHAWNYRRFVVELTKRSEQDELEYTDDMIGSDFSNYSAWHNRSVLLSSLLARKADGFLPNKKIPDEYKLVQNAIFTDEDDQSGWFYHLWLLDQTVNVETPLLTSSWPSHGSRISLYAGCSNGSFSKLTTFGSESGSFPLVLYFDQAVGGVSSSTVTIDSELKGNEDLVWEPVSKKNSQVSCVWVARLKYISSEPCFGKEYKVKVRVGNSPGIVSSRGFNFSASYEFVFTAHVHDTVEESSQEGIVSWTDGFDIWDAESKDLNALATLDRSNAQMDSKWRQEAIAEEIDLFRELPDSKIGKLTLARLLMAKAMISDDAVKGVHYNEILELYKDLMALDSSHYQYYKDEHSVALLRKVTSSTEDLSGHLFRCRNMNNSVCLRLNNLSLSRIASVEKLLFVQMLDLSHNELHSTEGLEAMQLLSCLNLSRNRIRSFSALDSLRHLKQLRVLDVSHNHIGEHSVDTTRYLCSSPLSNSEWPQDEVGSQMPSLATKYWDAYFVLRDLNLKQLDITGNVIAGDEFSSFVLQVVPKLVWLDGKKLEI